MIIVEDVVYRYDPLSEHAPPALAGVSLAIPDGTFLAVIGPNGSGKSTLGRCLNGLLRPTHGRVVVDGLDTAHHATEWDVRRRVGMMFQNPDNQLVSTTVEREIAFGLENLGLPTPDIRDRVDWALDRFHLAPYRLHPPHRLSGGQKQRLAIAAVVAMRPRHLVCDEPTTLLDPHGRQDVFALIARLCHDDGMTVVYITQFPDEAADADRVVLMAGGRVVEDRPPGALFCQTSLLTRHGLSVPLAAQVGSALRARGVPIPSDVIRPAGLLDALHRWPPVSVAPPQQATDRKPSLSSPALARPQVELSGVTHVYQAGTALASTALNGIDLRVAPGECVALIGPNGSGKSTLIQHLNGLLHPTSGRVMIDGTDLRSRGVDLRAIRQRVGLVFQFPEAQLFEETVYDDVAFGPRNAGLPEAEVSRRVREALDLVELDLSGYASRLPFSLSGGEKRRVAIAGVLAMQPRLLALDEPTAGLDPRGVRQMEGILKGLHGSGGTIVLISHDMDLVGRLAERVVVLDRGRVIADDRPETIFTDDSLLASVDLGAPGLVRLLTALRHAGYPVNTAVFDVETAAEEIRRILDCGF